MPTISKQVGGKQATVIKKRNSRSLVLDRIVPMEGLGSRSISVCLYGPSGSGKTSFWSTFPGRILAIVCSSIRNPGELITLDTPELRKKVDQFVVESPNELREIVKYQEEEQPYETVVMDHASGLQDYVLKEILGIDEIPAQLSWGIATKQDWGECSLKTKEYLRAILNLSCNRVIVCQQKEGDESPEEDGITIPHVGPALQPATAGWLMPACDITVQTFKKQKMEVKEINMKGKIQTVKKKLKGVDFCLRTGPHPTYMTKFRVPRGTELPDHIVDPDYDSMIKLIRGEA